MVSLGPEIRLTAGESVSQWAETIKIEVGLSDKETLCVKDFKKCLAGKLSSIDKVGDPCDIYSVSFIPPIELIPLSLLFLILLFLLESILTWKYINTHAGEEIVN